MSDNHNGSSHPGFVAINHIQCTPDYIERFEELFKTRARAIDQLDGFQTMYVLKSRNEDNTYLVVSHWVSEPHFKAWLGSDAFAEGHKRAFEDMRKAKASGQTVPMKSDFTTYEVLAR